MLFWIVFGFRKSKSGYVKCELPDEIYESGGNMPISYTANGRLMRTIDSCFYPFAHGHLLQQIA